MRNQNDVAHLFRSGRYGEGEASPASPAKGAACPAAELMRQGEWLAGRPLRVREPPISGFPEFIQKTFHPAESLLLSRS